MDSPPDGMTLDLLCKVVDNFGDIGLVYRLARALSEAEPRLELRLVVDDLKAFQSLAPAINPCLLEQSHRGWTIATWEAASDSFRRHPPRVVIECFACGRPQWFEDLLFDEADPSERLIVNLEYLSAEDYALDLHRLASATRSALVRKVFFMPGFCPGTGGLVIDRGFAEARQAFLSPASRGEARRQVFQRLGTRATGEDSATPREDAFTILVFTYELDFSGLVAALQARGKGAASSQGRWAERSGSDGFQVLLAFGRSAGPFLAAYETAGRPFPLAGLPFLPQETWDEVLLAADLALIRGEESLARAVLSGRPFLWHAYYQAGEHQLVKVEALLGRMEAYFPAEAFRIYRDLSLDLNRRGQSTEEKALQGPFRGPGPDLFEALLEALPDLAPGFRAFADSVYDLGDLAAHLLTFLGEFGYTP